jgi:hypothetical protein
MPSIHPQKKEAAQDGAASFVRDWNEFIFLGYSTL